MTLHNKFLRSSSCFRLSHSFNLALKLDKVDVKNPSDRLFLNFNCYFLQALIPCWHTQDFKYKPHNISHNVLNIWLLVSSYETKDIRIFRKAYTTFLYLSQIIVQFCLTYLKKWISWPRMCFVTQSDTYSGDGQADTYIFVFERIFVVLHETPLHQSVFKQHHWSNVVQLTFQWVYARKT